MRELLVKQYIKDLKDLKNAKHVVNCKLSCKV